MFVHPFPLRYLCLLTLFCFASKLVTDPLPPRPVMTHFPLYSRIDIASTSPPNARGFHSSNSSNPEYEVEVVEIRVKEGELDEFFH